ncbi:hypothetical protein F4823DRAFT_560574 [Ustulina deusta]|nr:hypothetical protein F4823DRAFT_560574 [Ustulina deusta]
MSYDFIATGRPRQVTLGLVATTYVHCDSRADDLLVSDDGERLDIGDRIKSMLYANALITRFIEWPVPPPLRAIVEACMCTRPEERPTRADLRAMIGQMQL